MTLERGSLILVDYTAKVKDSNEIFETTREEEAKKSELFDPTHKYEPRLISIGEGWVLKGLDEALAAANIGDRINVEITPDKGFGERDPNKVRMVAQRKLGEKADEVRVGDVIEIDLKGFILEIELPEETLLAEGLQIIKRAVANDVFKFVPSLKDIKFIESFQSPTLPQHQQENDQNAKIERQVDAKSEENEIETVGSKNT